MMKPNVANEADQKALNVELRETDSKEAENLPEETFQFKYFCLKFTKFCLVYDDNEVSPGKRNV